jgi:hypothetical protein
MPSKWQQHLRATNELHERYSLVDELLCDLNLQDDPAAPGYLAVTLIMLTIFVSTVIVVLALS